MTLSATLEFLTAVNNRLENIDSQMERADTQLRLDMVTIHPMDPYIRSFLQLFSEKYSTIDFDKSLLPERAEFVSSDGIQANCTITANATMKKLSFLFTVQSSHYPHQSDKHTIEFHFSNQEALYRWEKHYAQPIEMCVHMTPVSGFAITGMFCGTMFTYSREIAQVDRQG